MIMQMLTLNLRDRTHPLAGGAISFMHKVAEALGSLAFSIALLVQRLDVSSRQQKRNHSSELADQQWSNLEAGLTQIRLIQDTSMSEV
jgi:hypothetical protein